MPLDVSSIQLVQGTAIFVAVLIIAAGSLRMLTNPASPYWNLFSVGIFALWVALVFFNSTDASQLGKIVASFFAVITMCALWLGMRTENSRVTSVLWIPVTGLIGAGVPALGYLSPTFTTPIGSFAIVFGLGILTIRECLTGAARSDFFARVLAWTLGIMIAVMASLLLGGLNSGAGALQGVKIFPADLQVTIAVSLRFGLLTALILSVTVISARPIRKREPHLPLDAHSVRVGGTLARNPLVVLNRARQTETGLAVIAVEMQDAEDTLTVFGPVGMEAVHNAISIVIQQNISPMALIERTEEGRLLVLTETNCVDSTAALVGSLRRHIEETPPLINGQHISATFAFSDTRIDGYDWNELVQNATARLTASTGKAVTA